MKKTIILYDAGVDVQLPSCWANFLSNYTFNNAEDAHKELEKFNARFSFEGNKRLLTFESESDYTMFLLRYS